ATLEALHRAVGVGVARRKVREHLALALGRVADRSGELRALRERRAGPEAHGEAARPAVVGAAGGRTAPADAARRGEGGEVGLDAAVVHAGTADRADRGVLARLRAAGRGGRDAGVVRADGVERAVGVPGAARLAARVGRVVVAARAERAVRVRGAAGAAALRAVRVGVADLAARAVGVGVAEREQAARVGAAPVARRVLDDPEAVVVARALLLAKAGLRVARVARRAGPAAGDAGIQRRVAGLRRVVAVGVGRARPERVGNAGVGDAAGGGGK